MAKWLGGYLGPAGAEKDPEFKAEIERLSRRGLWCARRGSGGAR